MNTLTHYNPALAPAIITVLGTMPPAYITKPVTDMVVEYNAATDRTWALVPLAQEPLKDRYPIPARVQHRIKQLVDDGVDFDDLYIAHEFPGHQTVIDLRPKPVADYWQFEFDWPQIGTAVFDPILFGIKYLNGRAVWYMIDMWEW